MGSLFIVSYLMQTEQFDVVVIGGGMVGNAFACALGGSPLKIAVVEPKEPIDDPSDKLSHLRVSALTNASINILKSLGVWCELEKQVEFYRHMRVWDSTGSGEVEFDSIDVDKPFLGCIVENISIQTLLWQQSKKFSNIHHFCPNSLKAIDIGYEHHQVILDSNKRLSTRLIIAADGSASKTRQICQIETKGWSYDQTAVVATVKPELSHQKTAWQRFLPEGPLAFLPLQNDCCSIVWTNTADKAEELLVMKKLEFEKILSKAFDYRLGQVELVEPRATFPLKLQHSLNYVRPGIALIGDAAHAIHPLAGQGVNLGLLDAAALSQVLLEEYKVRQHKNMGDYAVLRKYERWRKADNLTMMFAMDAFKRLFCNEIVPLVWARNTGMSLFNKAKPVKNHVIKSAMGYSADLPDIAK